MMIKKFVKSKDEKYDTSRSQDEIEELIEQRKKRRYDDRQSLDKWQVGRRRFS